MCVSICVCVYAESNLTSIDNQKFWSSCVQIASLKTILHSIMHKLVTFIKYISHFLSFPSPLTFVLMLYLDQIGVSMLLLQGISPFPTLIAWYINRQTDQWNQIKNTEINQHCYEHLIFDGESKTVQWKR